MNEIMLEDELIDDDVWDEEEPTDEDLALAAEEYESLDLEDPEEYRPGDDYDEDYDDDEYRDEDE